MKHLGRLDETEEALSEKWKLVGERALNYEDDGTKMEEVLKLLAEIATLDNYWHILSVKEDENL
jgi:hypothetical protein